MTGLPWLRRLSALASLDDGNRRRLYEHVRGARLAVSRDDAARALGLPRSTASFHLDRLVRDGLLNVEFRKLGGKVGPGSGRPAKLYAPVMDEIGASVPERHYDLAGEVMASAIQNLMAEGDPPVKHFSKLPMPGAVRPGTRSHASRKSWRTMVTGRKPMTTAGTPWLTARSTASQKVTPTLSAP
ncbi:helix-turn-helix domain-containing protein [Arthrobacter sp. NA-172]|uniref:helix-turn-helix domain-containing protein n=1 Tax=Arthrobacter sp. NA-172 TaxID=3367524 RepID=UPI003754268E